MSKLLSEIILGDSIFIEEDGVAVEFMVIHHGLPSEEYDPSCEGTWVVRKNIYAKMPFDENNTNDYENSTINSYLNTDYFNKFTPAVQNLIQSVKIPYRYGSGTSTTVYTGSDGLSCKCFMLSAVEVGFTADNSNHVAYTDGSKLDYFDNISSNKAGCIATYNGVAAHWQIRTPYTKLESITEGVLFISTTGSLIACMWAEESYGVRPTFVLPSTLSVGTSGHIFYKHAPTITGEDKFLGEKATPFSYEYTVFDADSDETSVVEKLNSSTVRSYTATLGKTENLAITSDTFSALGEKNHSLYITAKDTDGNTVVQTLTFTKVKDSIDLSFDVPLTCDDRVTLGNITLIKNIDPEASFSVEVCNNGFDEEPTWEDVTYFVEHSMNFTLSNEEKTAEEWGYNIRIRSERNDATGVCELSYIGGFFK